MQKIKKQKALCFLLFFSLCFVGITFCTYFLFIKNGKSFIWNYDGIKQHYAALCYLGNYYRETVSGFLAGDFVLPMFDFSLGMGEDIITTLNFYGFGDPLTLLAAFVPAEKTEYLYDFLVIFRMYLAGLSFSWFCRQKKQSFAAAFIGALAYSFSGYVLHVAVKHPFFVIPMIFLPLAVIGVDRALEKKKLTLLIVVVFFTALNGFYFFYMNTVFLVIYALVKVICRSCREGARVVLKDIFAGAFRCIVAYGIGTLMAAALFVPSVMAYLTSTRSESAFDPGNLLFFDAERYNAIFTRLIGPPRITWDYLGMISLVLFAIIILFVGARKKNIVLKVNIIIWTLLMLIPFGGYMLNGFSYVSGRFMYLVTFVYAAGLVYALPELVKRSRRKLVICAGAVLVYLVAVLFSSDVDEIYGWFGFVMLAATFLVLALGSVKPFAEKLTPKMMYCVLAVVAALNIIGNGWLLFGGKGQGYLQSFVDSGTAYETVVSSPEAEAQTAGESEFWRTDASVKSTENTGMMTGKYGVSSYFSISNPNRTRYLLEMDNGGVLDSMFKIEGLDDRTYLEALASVRYYAVEASDESRVPYGYEFLKEFTRGNKTYRLFENTCFLPLGVTYDSYVTADSLDQETNDNSLKLQEIMLKTLVLEESPEDIQKLDELPETNERELPFEIVKTKHVEIEEGKVVVKKNGGSITLRLGEEIADAELYVSLEGFEITQKNRTYCGITVKSGEQKKTIQALTDQWNWYFGRDKYLFNLGLTSGKDLVCTITFEYRGKFDLQNLNVYAQGMEDYKETISARKDGTLQELSLGTNSVKGNIEVSEPQMLFLSIPYSRGWRAVVNGKAVSVYQANTAYMAVPLQAGDNNVELRYETPYLKAGAWMSLAGFILFVVYLLLAGRRH